MSNSAPTRKTSGPVTRAWQIVLLAIVYYAVARTSLGLSFEASNASPVWPPSGIALAALLFGGPPLALGVLIGAVLANLVTFIENGVADWSLAALASGLIGVGNLAEALAGTWLIRRFARGNPMDSPHSAYVFVIAAMAAAVLSATCGAGTLTALGLVPSDAMANIWLTWWLGDVTGLLIVTPLLLQVPRLRLQVDWRAVAQGVALFAGASWLTFGGWFAAGHLDRLAAFSLVVCVAWAGLQRGALAASLMTFAIAALSIVATAHGYGPFAKATINDSLVSLAGFLALCAISGMVLAATPRLKNKMSAVSRLPSAVLLAGLAITLLAWHLIAADTERRAADRFNGIAEEIRARVLERMRVYEQALRGGRGLFDASTSVERDEWRQYVASLRIRENYPGVQGLGFSQYVRADQRQSHTDLMRATGAPDYQLKPAGDRAEYTGIIYLEPQDTRNRRAIGYDMLSEPIRRAAMEHARDSGGPAISGKVKLVQETDKNVQAGVLMYVPVYQRGMPSETVEQRRAALIGYVYSPFRMGDLMEAALERADLTSISLALYDGDKKHPSALMYTNTARHGADYPHQFAKALPIEVTGHRWLADIASTQNFEATVDTQKAQISMIAGTLISLLLFTVVRSLSTMREEALELAQRMSASRTEAEQRFQSLAEAAGDGILVLDAAGCVNYANQAACQLFGMSINQLQGVKLRQLIMLPEPFDAWMQRARNGHAPSTTIETACRASHGAFTPIEMSLSMWQGVGQRFYSVSLRDISVRKLAEESLRDAVEKAQQANLAKSQFLANMSHEIRTPMNAVIGLTYLFEQTPLNNDQAGLLANMKLASRSLLATINNILDLSKIEANELAIEEVPFDLRSLLEDLIAIMSVQARGKGIELKLELPDALPLAVEGDAVKVNQILTNLLANAIKFTDHGTVRLGVRITSESAADIRLHFSVLDTGIGISPEAQARLFSPFVQADASTTRRFGGTGLGLSIVKRLTQLMGGNFGLTSASGAGSEFWVELGFAKSSVATLPLARDVASRERLLEGLRVLVVDDSEINRDVAKRILMLAGAHVELAVNGEQACYVLGSAAVPFDAVLMDLQMPVMDGYDATRRIRRELGLRKLPVIALTAGALVSEGQRAAEAGMNDFLTKPFEPQSLVLCICKHCSTPKSENPIGANGAARNIPSAWPDIDGIELKGVRERCAGDVELFGSMLARMLDEFADLETAGSALAPEAGKSLQARMHKLKGSAATLGARNIAGIASAAEAALSQDELAQTSALLQRLAVAFKETRLSAEPFLNTRTPAQPGEKDPSGAEPDAFSQLARLLRAHDLAALDEFNERSAQLRAKLSDASFERFAEHLENLRFEHVVELLEAESPQVTQ